MTLEALLRGHLQGVVVGVEDRGNGINRPIAWERPNAVQQRRGCALYRLSGGNAVGSDRGSAEERCISPGQRLVQVKDAKQVRAL